MKHLLYISLSFFSILPDKLIYLFSDVLFVIIYRLCKYRIDIVRNNLQMSFPNSTLTDQKTIEVASYRNFCDILVESLLLNSISKVQLQKKMTLINPEVFNGLHLKKNGIMLVGAHYNNWEWMALSLSSYLNVNMYTVYKPLSNKFADCFMKNSRKRFGAKLVPMNTFAKTVLNNKNHPSVNLMLVDQSPHKSKLDFFCSFLNQDTPVYLGPEKLIKSASLELNYIEVQRVKRGHYEMKVVPLSNPSSNKSGEITKLHVKYLENLINLNPHNWLWTHRRWKHSRKK